jgi:hypothetical protein
MQGQPGGPRGAGQQQLQAPTALSAQQSVGGSNSPTQQSQQQQQQGVAAGGNGSSGAEQLLTGIDSLGLPGSHLDPSLEVRTWDVFVSLMTLASDCTAASVVAVYALQYGCH